MEEEDWIQLPTTELSCAPFPQVSSRGWELRRLRGQWELETCLGALNDKNCLEP